MARAASSPHPVLRPLGLVVLLQLATEQGIDCEFVALEVKLVTQDRKLLEAFQAHTVALSDG